MRSNQLSYRALPVRLPQRGGKYSQVQHIHSDPNHLRGIGHSLSWHLTNQDHGQETHTRYKRRADSCKAHGCEKGREPEEGIRAGCTSRWKGCSESSFGPREEGRRSEKTGHRGGQGIRSRTSEGRLKEKR